MIDFNKLLIWQQGMIFINKVYDIIPQKFETKTEQTMLTKFIDKVGS
jgi:hypothetical protein